jgi:nucleoside-diphosphate-sugar epimerase
MRVLILGGTGFVGRHLANRLCDLGIDYKNASRSKKNLLEKNFLMVDTRDKSSLVKAMTDIDIVINCVAGDYNSIANGSTCLVDAALQNGIKPLIIHMSSMAVYGRFEGNADEATPLNPNIGWYAQAKCIAEEQIKRYCSEGGSAIIFRPGCVYGKGSELWVGRICRWLKSGRIGDLGSAGDGWSNLVHIDDVVTATISSFKIDLIAGGLEVFNLAAPDNPRWNNYFIDLALSIAATPVRRIGRNQLILDSFFFSPPVKLAQILLRKLNRNYKFELDPLPPNLVKSFKQQIKLDSTKAGKLLVHNWISCDEGIKQSLLS